MNGLGEALTPAGPGKWRLRVWVSPGAKRNELLGVIQGSMKVKIAAPAVDNKANDALVRYVARLLGLKRRQVRLESGPACRRKTLLIESETAPVRVETEPAGLR